MRSQEKPKFLANSATGKPLYKRHAGLGLKRNTDKIFDMPAEKCDTALTGCRFTLMRGQRNLIRP